MQTHWFCNPRGPVTAVLVQGGGGAMETQGQSHRDSRTSSICKRGGAIKNMFFNLKSKTGKQKNQMRPIKVCFSFADREKEKQPRRGEGREEDK